MNNVDGFTFDADSESTRHPAYDGVLNFGSAAGVQRSRQKERSGYPSTPGVLQEDLTPDMSAARNMSKESIHRPDCENMLPVPISNEALQKLNWKPEEHRYGSSILFDSAIVGICLAHT